MNQTVQIFSFTHNAITSDIVGNQNKLVTLQIKLIKICQIYKAN